MKGSTTSSRVLRDSRIGAFSNLFSSAEIQRKYDSFNSNIPLFSWPYFLFYMFAVVSTVQYCGLWPAGINGEFGPVIRISFLAWIAGITALTTSLITEYVYSIGLLDRNRGIQLRNFLTSLFILLQPLVHGCLIYGRTLSLRVCRPEGYNDKSRSIIAVMEEQMTCNTSVDGRVPPELTVCMALFMLFHQNIFPNVSWLVIASHWLVGLSFLSMAHLQALADHPESLAHGEAIAIISCFSLFFVVLYIFERRKKEIYVLTLQLNKDNADFEKTRPQFFLQQGTATSTAMSSNLNSSSKRHTTSENKSISSVTMSELNPYDDYDQFSERTGSH
jgi:hypothetical protein